MTRLLSPGGPLVLLKSSSGVSPQQDGKISPTKPITFWEFMSILFVLIQVPLGNHFDSFLRARKVQERLPNMSTEYVQKRALAMYGCRGALTWPSGAGQSMICNDFVGNLGSAECPPKYQVILLVDWSR